MMGLDNGITYPLACAQVADIDCERTTVRGADGQTCIQTKLIFVVPSCTWCRVRIDPIVFYVGKYCSDCLNLMLQRWSWHVWQDSFMICNVDVSVKVLVCVLYIAVLCFYFQGRNPVESSQMIAHIREHNKLCSSNPITISIEVEKTRPELMNFISMADVVCTYICTNNI